MWRLARAEVDDGELHVVEADALPTGNRGVGEDSIRRPVLAEKRADDLILDGIVRRDRVDDSLRCVDRDVVAGDDLAERGVVVGVRVRQEGGQERLPEALDTGAHLLGG